MILHFSLGSTIAHTIVRAAIYRVAFGIPMGLVIAAAVVAGLFILRSRRGH